MRRFFAPRLLVPCTPALYREAATTAAGRVERPTSRVNFDDPLIYREKSMWELVRALGVLKLCGKEYFTRNSVTLMKRSERILGKRLTHGIIKRTLYGHFCAGESDKEMRDTVHRLDAGGIGVLLGYTAEAGSDETAAAPTQSEAPDHCLRSLVKKSSMSYTLPESTFESNLKVYIMSIMDSPLHCPTGYRCVAAVKVTGMCDPQLLARVSSIVLYLHECWSRFFPQEVAPKGEECRMITGVKGGHLMTVSTEAIRRQWERRKDAGQRISDGDMDKIIATLDPEKTGYVTYFRFKDVVSRAILALNPTYEQKLLASLMPEVSAVEKKLWDQIYRRLSLCAATAKELQVRLFVDAEQTFYQLAMDLLVGQLQARFNKEQPVVYNTYQCYMTHTEDRVYNDLQRAEYLGFHWGGKVVRGAYMVQERKTAEEHNYTSPIWPTIEDTAKSYASVADRVMKAIRDHPQQQYEVFFGSHNKDSLNYITNQVLAHGILHDRVAFGQLLGMRDHVTIPLAKAGFMVYKYVPYGPVRETILYLGRRAVENSSIFSCGEETRLMKKEVIGRLTFRAPR